MSVAVVGVGSNLGSREASIRAAHTLLGARVGIEVTAMSPLYETEPVGPPQPRYLNAALRLDTTLTPRELLRVLLRTEERLGRTRKNTERWGPRSLDLDLLWDARGPYESTELRVPHPELGNRSFALTPLLAVAPELQTTYGPLLEAAGDSLIPWDRAARVSPRRSLDAPEVHVQADSLVDGCALAIPTQTSLGRPLSTIHCTIDSSATAFADVLRHVRRSGFSVHCATVSHCSKTQWRTHLHGVNLAIPLWGDVRLATTSGSERALSVSLSVDQTPR